VKTRFTGPLGDMMKRHLQLRRSLGYHLRTDEIALDQFDAYVAANFPEIDTVTRPMVAGYLKTTGHLQGCTRRQQLTTIRQFCRFLFQLKPETYIPEARLLPAVKSQFRPHIYSVNEVNDLMRLAMQLPPAGSLRPHTFATLIGLLWASGLRSGEAVHLNLEDVDLEQGILHIRQTKNFKSRLVPVSASTRIALLAYRDMRAQCGRDPNPEAPFFVNERARRYARRTVDGTFRILTRELGLKSAGTREPRLHDLRHTWATRCLARLYQTGKDPNALLPVLATYLGHMNIACTTVYLHPAPDLLVQAGSQFLNYVMQTANPGGVHE
jgi:integrase/recombinase XerD